MKIKVDFIISTLRSGGAERVLSLVAGYLADQEYDVSIITFKGGEVYELNPKINRVKLYSKKGEVKTSIIKSIYKLKKYYKNKSNRPDIIISFTTTINMISIVVSKKYGIKIIVSEHNNYLKNFNKKSSFIKKNIYRYANLLTVLTSYDIDYYQKYKSNVIVMPNPCSFISFKDKDAFRESTLLAVGSLNRYHHKGFDNLIEIIKPILKENPLWKLKIVGGGDSSFIKELVIKEKIEEQVIFVGFTKKVAEIMQRSEIFILSSRFEGLPMVLLEAMSQGMACISYDCKTGPSDIIEDRIDGILVEDQNIDQMQIELRKLIKDEKLRKELRGNAIDITNKYSVELIGSKWEEAISDVIN